jgi:cellulose binding protein with CBM2 domain
MDDSSSPPRRSLLVVLLDATLGLVTAVQTGNLPGARRGAATRPAGRRGRAGLLWLLAGVLVVAGATTILIGALLRTPGGLADLPPAGLAGPAPATSIAAPATVQRSVANPSASASTSAPASTTPSGSNPASAAVPPAAPSSAGSSSGGGSHLTATYAAANGSGLLGYRATVTVSAGGTAPSTGWQMTITLPRPTLQTATVSGATAKQDGSVWTFTPVDATRSIAAGTSVVIAFDVRGATLVDAQPTDCKVNGETCAGLAG